MASTVQDCATLLGMIAGCDALVMPTNISPPAKIEKDVGKGLSLPGMLKRTIGGTYSTAAFNIARNIRGLVCRLGSCPRGTWEMWLPTGLQMGRNSEDFTCLEVAAGWNELLDEVE